MSSTINNPSTLFFGPISFMTEDGGTATIGMASSEDNYTFSLFKPSGDANYTVVTTPTGIGYLPFVPFNPNGTALKFVQSPFVLLRNGPTQGNGTIGFFQYTESDSIQIRTFTVTGTDGQDYLTGVGKFHFANDTTFAVPIPITSGGTGSNTAAEARANLGINFPLTVGNGGTGVTNLAALAANLAIPLRFTEQNSEGRNLTVSDNGGIFRAQSGAQSIRYNLPPGANTPNGWTATFVKGQAANLMRISPAPGTSDTIGNITTPLDFPNLYTSLTVARVGNNWFVTSFFNGNLIT